MGSPSIETLFAQRVTIGVGDMSASNNPVVTLSTYALGSCVAIAAYDPFAKVGGMLHLMLPESKLSPEKARAQPAMFADTGLPLLFHSIRGLKGDLGALRLFVAGGASVLCANDTFKIGERNIRATADYLAHHGYSIQHFEVGGVINRTLHLEVGSGKITLKTPDGKSSWSLGL